MAVFLSGFLIYDSGSDGFDSSCHISCEGNGTDRASGCYRVGTRRVIQCIGKYREISRSSAWASRNNAFR